MYSLVITILEIFRSMIFRGENMFLSKKRLTAISAVFILMIYSVVFADEFDDTLKGDFSKQQTIKIRFEVNKRLFSFEAGKFKLENIKNNRNKIRSITDRIVPWAIMEHLEPSEVARIIVYMYHAEEAGAPFNDAEDLIPLVAKKEIPIKDFVLMVQFNRETKNAGIPEEIRNAYLGLSVQRGCDGVSILTGGRGLILARMAGLNINKVGALLLNEIPAKGAGTAPGALVTVVENIIGSSAKEQNAQNIMKNLDATHKAVTGQENSPEGVRKIIDDAAKATANIQKANTVKITETPAADSRIDSQTGIIPEKSRRAAREGWERLRQNALVTTVKPWLGTPYDFGNKTGKGGIDCSGYTLLVLTNDKIGVPEDVIGQGTVNQINAGRAVKKSELLPGDLIFFSASPDKSKITHVALMVTPSIFSHASSSKGVIFDELTKKYWASRYIAGRRVFKEVIK